MATLTFLTFYSLSFAAACFAPDDSAGVGGVPASAISVGDTIWSLGVFQGVPEEEFGRIGDAALDSEGRVYLLDTSARVVRVFSADGRFLVAIGGSGRGPGEFADPRAILHNRKDSLYVLDEVNGLIVFRTKPDIRLVRTASAISESVRGSDFCLLGDYLYAFGLSDGDYTLHKLSHEGLLVRSFGSLFGGPEGHPIQRHLSGTGRIACSAEHGVVLAASGRLPIVRAYNVENLRLMWSDALPNFTQVFTQVDPPGMPKGFYAVGDPPGGQGSDQNIVLHDLGGGFILSQSVRVYDTDTVAHSVVGSCVVGILSGPCQSRTYDLPILLDIFDTLAVAAEERDFPVVLLLKVAARTRL